jgi:hypothetical protein
MYIQRVYFHYIQPASDGIPNQVEERMTLDGKHKFSRQGSELRVGNDPLLTVFVPNGADMMTYRDGRKDTSINGLDPACTALLVASMQDRSWV